MSSNDVGEESNACQATKAALEDGNYDKGTHQKLTVDSGVKENQPFEPNPENGHKIGPVSMGMENSNSRSENSAKGTRRNHFLCP